MNQRPNGFGRGRGQGRGRAAPAVDGNRPFDIWNSKAAMKTAKQEAKNSSRPSFNSSGVTKSTLNKEEEWRDRETASEGRLEKARKIRKDAAEKYSHLLEDTDSSDEELREEEIMKKTLNNYTNQLFSKIEMQFFYSRKRPLSATFYSHKQMVFIIVAGAKANEI